MTRHGDRAPHFEVVPYGRGNAAWRYLDGSAHYLENPPPGALLAVGVYDEGVGLFDFPVGDGPLRGLLLLGRPTARMLPQDGTEAEITRLVLDDGFPRGTASALVRFAIARARARGIRRVIAYHDRTRHSGCIYRKAGMRKERKTEARTTSGWETRGRKASTVAAGQTPKTRWSIDLTAEAKVAA